MTEKNKYTERLKPYFPWSLFLAMAVVFMLLASVKHARSAEDVWACYGAQRYQAMSSAWPACNELSDLCRRVHEYRAANPDVTPAQGRAQAEAKGYPDWLIRRGERCLPK